MSNKIVFFNHYHRGDLFTCRAFVEHLKNSLPNFDFEYLHYNHPKVIRDLGINFAGIPHALNSQSKFIEHDDVLYVNTWIGAYPENLKKYDGISMMSLYDSWKVIYEKINEMFSLNIEMKTIEEYLPSINYEFYNLDGVNNWLRERNNTKKVLLCNGNPMSSQSFFHDMKDQIAFLCSKYPNVDFICTKKINFSAPNLFFTDDIIFDDEIYELKVPWNDRTLNNCDLNEISYLSTYCDIIIGKNSGPFVFCETKENFSDENKIFISLSNGESMSKFINIKCDYVLQNNFQSEVILNTIQNKIDTLCFKVKRPKFVEAINLMIENSVKSEQSLIEDSVKKYKGL